jgi:hypothetical protein
MITAPRVGPSAPPRRARPGFAAVTARGRRAGAVRPEAFFSRVTAFAGALFVARAFERVGFLGATEVG